MRKKSDVISVDDVSTVNRKPKIKKEPSLSATTNGCVSASESQNDQGDLKDEPGDFIETNCHWRDCSTEFPTQDDLVKVRAILILTFKRVGEFKILKHIDNKIKI